MNVCKCGDVWINVVIDRLNLSYERCILQKYVTMPIICGVRTYARHQYLAAVNAWASIW